MSKGFRFSVVLVILLLLLGVFVQGAGAQDGDGADSITIAELVEAVQEADQAEEAPAWQDTFKDVLWGVGYGSAIVVLFALAVAAVVLLMLLIKWLFSHYVAIDSMLAPFGRTPYGQAAYAATRQLYQRVDEPTDSLIVNTSELAKAWLPAQILAAYTKVLPDSPELLSPEQLSHAARVTINGVSELLNGIGLPDSITPQELVDEWGKPK